MSDTSDAGDQFSHLPPEIAQAQRDMLEREMILKTFADKANVMLGEWIEENIFNLLPRETWKMPVLGDFMLIAEISDIDDGASIIGKWHSTTMKRHQAIGLLREATRTL